MKTLIATTAMIMTMTTAAMADSVSRLNTCLIGAAINTTAYDLGAPVADVRAFLLKPKNAALTNEVVASASALAAAIEGGKDGGATMRQVVGVIDLDNAYYEALVANCVIDFYSQGA